MDLMAKIAAAKAAAKAKQAEKEAEHEKEIETTPTPAPAPRAEKSSGTVGAAEPTAASETRSAEPTSPAPATGGLRLPARPATLKPLGAPSGLKPAARPAPAATHPISSSKQTDVVNPAPALAARSSGSILSTLTARRDAAAGKPPTPDEAARLAMLGKADVTDAAKSAIQAGQSYSPEEFLQEWNQLDADDDSTIDDRTVLLRKACAEIQRLYEHEVEGLRTGAANDLSIVELSQLIKLTFIRVKDSPAAWAMLDRTDKSAVVKAIIAMATKRNSAVKSRKPKDAAAMSASLDAAGDPAVDAVADAFAGIDFGDF